MNNLSHIFGCPRSGTTWLWSLLEEHPNIEAYVKGNKVDGKYKTSESGIYVNEPTPLNLINFCNNQNTKIVIEKTPVHTLYYNKIRKYFPSSKDILIVRHPISIYESWIKSNMSLSKMNIDNIIKTIKTYFVMYDIISKNSYTITYSELKKNPQNVMDGIFEYLDIDTIEYSDFNLQTKVNLSHVFRKGQSYVPSKETEHLNKTFENEIEIWKKYENSRNNES